MKNSLQLSGKVKSAIALITMMMTLILLIQSNVALSQTPGTATVITPTGGFGIDGNLQADGGVGDWLQNNVPQGGFVLYNDATPVNPIMTFHLEDAYAPYVDDVFKGGKIYDDPNIMQWENQQANGKSDMNHGFLHLTKDVSGNEWAIFSSDRKTANGVSYLDFEFLQKPITQNANGTFSSQGINGGRTIGDFVVSATFGNGTTTFQVWTWQQTSPGVYTYVPYTGSLTGIAYAAENLNSIAVPHLAFGQPTYPANTYVEGAMNISQFIGAALPCTNTQIFTLFIKTKTSPSIEATIQDFITPIQIYSLTVGTANAGPDQTLCDEGDFTTFTLNGQAIPVTGTSVISTTWSVVNYNGTQAPVIANPSSLNTTVNVYDGTATLKLTVVTTINGTDFCTVSDEIVLNINPKPAPTWTNPPADITVSCADASSIGPTSLSYSNNVTGQCNLSGSVLGVISGSYNECGGLLTQTWTYNYPPNGVITYTQNITVLPAPQAQFAAVSPVTITCNQATTYAPSNLTYSNSGLGGCLIQGQVMGSLIPNYTECGGTITQNWTFTDNCGRTSTQSQVITVSPSPVAAFVNPPANTTITCNAATSFAATSLSYTNAGSGGCLIAGQVTGVISGSYNECGGTLYQTWTFVDNCNRQIQHVQTITVSPAPQAQFVAVSPVTITCDQATTYAPSYLTYTNSGSGGCLIQGQVLGSLTPNYTECGGTITQNWTFTDNCGRTSTQSQIITVSPSPVAVFVNPPANTTITCNAATSFAATSLSYTNAGSGGCLIAGQVTGVISGSYNECGGTLYQTWTFVDNCNRQIQHVQTITVSPAPQAQFASVSPLTITCNEATTFTASNLSYSNAGSGGCLIQGQVPGSLTPNYTECGGFITQNWTFTDNCGRTSTQSQVITVLPAPQAQFAAVTPVTITCNEATTYAPSYLSYTNAGLGGCLIEGQVMGSLTPNYTECGGTITQSWSFTDDCGRTCTQTQTITVLPAPMAAFVNPPADITITCDAATTFAATNISYSNAGLGGCIIAGQVTGVITGSYTECGGTLYETWTFVDDCSRQIQHVQTITVLPAPQAQFEPVEPITITCDEATTYAASYLGYTNSGLGGCLIQGQVMGSLTPNYTECGGTITQNWTYTDDCGRISTQTQVITVLPAPQAQFAAVSPVTITCDQATTYAASYLGYTNSGLGGCLIQGQVMGSLTPNYTECGGTITQNWTYTDDCGRISTQTQIITVLPAPQAQFAAVSPVTITCDQATTYAPSYLGYTNAGLGGCLIQGEVMGSLTPNYTECGGTITQNWTYTDDCGRISTQTQVITVLPAPQAQFAAVTPVTITCNEATTYAPSYLGYTNAGLGGCLIQGEVMGSLTPNYTECGGTITQNWTYTDDCGRISTQTQIITVLPAPIAAFTNPPADITITCNAATTLAATSLSYTNEGLGGCLIAGQVTGVITGSYTECGGTLYETWTFIDDCGRQIQHVQAITVSPAPIAAFVNPPANTTITCDAATTFAATSLSYTNEGLGGCLIAGQVTGVITGSYTECGGTLYETWTFVDDCGRQIQHVQTITVSPAPIAAFVNPPANTTITCDAATTFAATSLSYTNEGLGGCLIAGQVTGVISGSYTECGGTLYETWTFTDDCERVITYTQTINVLPAPIAAFTNPPADITITCDAATTFAATSLSYTNAGLGGCLIAGQVTGVITGSYTECGGTLYETWTFTDDCERVITYTQTINVLPAPQAQFAAVEPVTITCDQATTHQPSYLGYTNAGLGGCLIQGQVMGTLAPDYTECGGTITQSWTYTDDCGRTSTQTQVITVLPAPMAAFTNPPADITITCDAATSFAATSLSYTNAGLGGCLIAGQVTGVISGSYTECGGTLYQTWTFVDDCNRQIQHIQTITVLPAPIAAYVNPPAEITITCDAATGFAASNLGYTNSGLGGCLIEGQVLGVITGSYTECGGTLYQTWTFVDDCERVITYTQTINVLPAPIAAFVNPPAEITITCDAATSFAASNLGYTNSGLGGCLIEGQVPGVITGSYTECGGTLYQTWTFTDDCERVITYTQTINVLPAPIAAFVNPPAEITITCNAATSFAASTLGYSNSGLGGCLIEGQVLGVISGSYTECGGTLYQTWTFTDDCQRVITYTQTIHVSPAPQAVFVNPPANITITCGEATSFAVSSLSYSNAGLGGCLISGQVNGVLSGSYSECGGTMYQTWTFTDLCNRTTTYVQTITVTAAPQAQFAPVQNYSISCENAASLQPSYLTYTNNAVNGCLISGQVLGVITGNYNNCNGILTQTWTFTDNCGRTSTQTQTINIYDNTAPTFTAPANVTIYTDENCNYNASVSVTGDVTNEADNCSVNIQATYTDVVSNGICEGSHTIYRTWSLVDNCGNAAPTQLQVITVEDNMAPVIITVAGSLDATVECSDPQGLAAALALVPTADDNCSAELTMTLVSDVTTNSQQCDNEYTRVRTWNFTDDCGNVSANFVQTINVVDNTNPVWTVLPSDLTVECDGEGNTSQLNAWLNTPAGTDNCGIASVTNNYTTLSNGCGNTGSALVTFTLTDECGNAVTATATFSIVDTQNPTISVPSNLEIDTDPGVCGAQITLIATGGDDCGEVTITNDLTGSANASGFYNAGVTIIHWTATDECGNTVTAQTMITVIDEEPPMIICPPHITVNADDKECGAYVNVPAPIVSDNCEIRTVTNTFNGTDDASGFYPIGTTIVWWTVVDMDGNTDNCFMNVTVNDNQGPSIICPDNISVSNDPGTCGAYVTVPAPEAEDNCPGITVVNSFNGTGDASGSYPVGTTTITWTVTDANGHTAECTMTVTVNDTESPIIICPDDIATTTDAGACGAQVTIPQPEASDNCGVDQMTNDFNNSANASGFYPVGTTVVSWTVTDAHGNTAICQMNVVVTDNENPTIICPQNITVSASGTACNAYVEIPEPTGADNCGVAFFSNSVNNTGNASGTYELGTTEIIWTVTDIHGNTATCQMTVTVIDDVNPEITCIGEVTAVAGENCMAQVTIPQPEVSDNCGETTVINSFNNSGNASGNYPVGVTVVTWTVTDIHGNVATCVTTVTVSAPPVAVDDNATTNINTPVSVTILANDTDCANDIVPSTVVTVTDPVNGTVVVNTDGTVTYTPNNNFTGTDTFTYRVCDEEGLCDEAVVTIVISGEILTMTAVDDEYTTLVDTPVDIANLTNDIYPVVVDPVVTLLTPPSNGNLIINSDMTAVYTPNPGFIGIDSYTYTLSDANNLVASVTAVTTINVNPNPERDTIVIYNVITPDGDGHNDRWIIDNIEEYSDNEVLIFNRWGDQLHYFEGYNNTTVVWDGTNRAGDMLPAATYYYIIKLRDIKKVYTGWVVVHAKK